MLKISREYRKLMHPKEIDRSFLFSSYFKQEKVDGILALMNYYDGGF